VSFEGSGLQGCDSVSGLVVTVVSRDHGTIERVSADPVT
jgi:hypothetical protein